MALSAEKLAAAKAEARSVLEYSIAVICASLGVDPESINDSYDHETDPADPEFPMHQILKKMVQNYAAIDGE